MSQSDYNIGANPSGLNMRTEINQVFDSILTHNSGSTAPTVTSAFMMWVDTSNATYYYLKMRNHVNTAWVTLGIYTVATKTYTSYTNDTVKLTDTIIGTGTQSFNGFGGSGFKNYIINGGFDIWQYKDAGLTYPQTSSGYSSDDRWHNANVGSTKVHSRVECADTERALFNANYFSRTVVTSVAGSGNFVLKQQSIENVTRLSGKTVTLSFWAKADSNKNIEINLVQGFGTGGSPSASITNIGQQLIPLTSTWQKITRTITVPSIAGKTLGTDGVHTSITGVRFIFDARSGYDGSIVGQQSGTFDIAQVQLEVGSVATPFEDRPIGLELSLCQRYYEVCNVFGSNYSNSSSGTNFRCTQVQYKVTKRVIPSISTSDQTYSNCNNINTENSGRASIGININCLGIGTMWVSATLTASAEL